MFNILSRLKIQDVLDRDPDKFESRPRLVWVIIFFTGAIFIILVSVAHSYLYVYMHTDSSFKPDEDITRTDEMKLNRKGLVDAIAFFEEKNARFQNLLVSPPQVSDPSQDAELPVPSPTPVPAGSGVTIPKVAPKNTNGDAPASLE